ncbi:glycosyltransferase [Polaribacter ponticola]|uniref:glycosyltransferase n=1 Tax=Polaribacter ponticola TaxID=2978475 RepID=UPI0030825F18
MFLIDNSPTNKLENLFKDKEIEYIFVNDNLGFGRGHNLVLERLDSDFHLILNPDVVFLGDVIPNLINKLRGEENVSFITPKVLYPNGDLQFICRKHPTFLDLINRKLKISKNMTITNEYRDQDLTKSFCPNFIHGCFMLFKTKDFKDIKGFDERYFLYMEDADICRKIEVTNKKILYFPEVEITHQHQKGSSKSIKLFFYHLSSAIKYFLKWGF